MEDDERSEKVQQWKIDASDIEDEPRRRKKRKKKKRQKVEDEDKEELEMEQKEESKDAKTEDEKDAKTEEEKADERQLTCSKFIAHVKKTFPTCNCNDIENVINGVEKGTKDKASTTNAAKETTSECNDSAERNTYSSRKTIAKGLLDVALLTQNAKQLRELLISGPDNTHFSLVLTLLIVSLTLQAAVAVMLLFMGSLDVDAKQKHANRLNNVSTAFTMAITVVNIFIAMFDVKDEVGC